MSLAVRLNRSKFEDQCRKLEQSLYKKTSAMKIEAEEKMRMVAADTAFKLLLMTMPSELSGIGKSIARMRYDVKNTYLTGGAVYKILVDSNVPRIAAAFYSAYKRGNFAQAETILRASGTSISSLQFGDPERYEGEGMVKRQKRKIVSQTAQDAYMKWAIARLGRTASGWAACIEKLGFNGNGIKWKGTAIHGSSGGDVNIIHDKYGVSYRLVNLRPLARKLINPGQVASIMKESEEFLLRELARK